MGDQTILKTLLYTVNSVLQQRRYHTMLAVLKGVRNGAVYGAKIRAPHALVMTFLFKSGSLKEKLKAILQATYTHSRCLAYFVFVYKGLMAMQSQMQGKKVPLHSFIAAFIGGWLVFGENNNINSQVNMYVLSRILFGLSRLAVEKGYIPQPKQDTSPIFAAVIWGLFFGSLSITGTLYNHHYNHPWPIYMMTVMFGMIFLTSLYIIKDLLPNKPDNYLDKNTFQWQLK